ncbi:MAG TPA: phosphoribosyltransferase [Chloroflexi bacterium]|nr:phosphoribosyltransferase [Chloroflexota bacterium]
MQRSQRPLRHEVLTWQDVDRLMDVLLAQLREAGTFDAILMITRGGIIPGGMIAEALDIRHVLTAAVRFPTRIESRPLAAWPEFLQFPADILLKERRTLIVDDVWGSGRTSTAVRGRVEAAGGKPATCVLHFNPYRSLFSSARPDFYGAITDAWIVYPWEIDRDLNGISPLPPVTPN